VDTERRSVILLRATFVLLILVTSRFVASCGGTSLQGPSSPSAGTGVLDHYKLAGNVAPVHDPSIIRQGNTYYAFTTDAPGTLGLPIRCSEDKINWRLCGQIFYAMPAWVGNKIPGSPDFWAPDVSYFSGLYHVYYAVSVFGQQQSVIGLVTNTTLDAADSSYKWIDQGEVLESNSGDNFNAIDPNILIDTDASVWMSYGSYWNGIFQRQIDPSTGKLLASNPQVYHLARRTNVAGDPIEGSSQLHHGNFYYLFVSIDFCCMPNLSQDNYKIAVGRSASPHGPFLDQSGVDMLNGGLTLLLAGNSTWGAPGGQTAYYDPIAGNDLLVFHALNLQQNGLDFLWLNQLSWDNDWPVIQPNN
jgi:arabinan endo-1,5-alpha-L-arabinosidase